MKTKIVIYADDELASNWTGFGNGESHSAIAKALLSIAIKYGESPFGISKLKVTNEKRTVFSAK